MNDEQQRFKDSEFVYECASLISHYDRSVLKDKFAHTREDEKTRMRTNMKKLIEVALAYIDA